jgi:hypothetical protein
MDEPNDPYVLSPGILLLLALFLFLPTGFCLALLHVGGVPSLHNVDWPALLTLGGWLGTCCLAAFHWQRSWLARGAPMAATIVVALQLEHGPITGSTRIAAAAVGLLATFGIWVECR